MFWRRPGFIIILVVAILVSGCSLAGPEVLEKHVCIPVEGEEAYECYTIDNWNVKELEDGSVEVTCPQGKFNLEDAKVYLNTDDNPTMGSRLALCTKLSELSL